ncbi:MAG: hypothetical protein K9G64_06795 [Bacteroidia bacterium]|nr:hypothetical protein [Bacteroidia bacterium]
MENHEVQQLSFEEYKSFLKKADNPLAANINKRTRFFKETKFFIKFAFVGLILLTLLALLTAF